jgi:membrane protease YdiL (CAAX protease family)
MQFLVDPSRVPLTPSAWVFLVIVCVIFPLGAVRQHGRFGTINFLPSRRRIYVSALITHLMLLALAWFTMRDTNMQLWPAHDFGGFDVAIGAIALATGLPPLLRKLRPKDPVARERIRLIAPRTASEFGLFYLVSVSAGVVEELTYRGVLFAVLSALVRSWWIAAVLGAAVFGIVHLFQGWKSAGIATLIGLREQIVVGLTGTLLVAIVVHALHDIITGTTAGLSMRAEAAGDVAAPVAGVATGAMENG